VDKSYGIQVANLAGLPDEVIQRSKEILNQLEENDINHPFIMNKKKRINDNFQVSMFEANAMEQSQNREYKEFIKIY